MRPTAAPVYDREDAGSGAPVAGSGGRLDRRCLTELAPMVNAVVLGVSAPLTRDDADLALRLGELGFLPGERVRIIARAPLGGPFAVRVGTATFALRPDEAACIEVGVPRG